MPAVAETIETVQSVQEGGYKWGFETDIEMEFAPKGLNEDIVRFISRKKEEPEWLLAWRLKAFATWQRMQAPRWAAVSHPPIDFQDAYYYAAPKNKIVPKSLDEVDPELLRTYEKLGIPLREQERLQGIAVDAVFDSVSVA
ncbi:MAG: Fe-S cluster assembly protein SufB, partial [Rubritepida sp.]|nr:Fe-S cluster assembly protein SufB [Rubritepida sp.]